MDVKLSFKLDDFEGPLDLLLSLLAGHKIDIRDIPIFSLVTQYLEIIKQWQMLDPLIAAEFLAMAARLIHIKTVMLLPRHEEEAAALEKKLSGELVEYQTVKQLAALFRERYEGQGRFVRPPVQFEIDPTYALCHPPDMLADALRGAVGKRALRMPPPVSAFSGIVGGRQVSVASRVLFVLRHLYREPVLLADRLFMRCQDRPEMVATFLAVLELVRAGRVDFDEQTGTLSFMGRRSEEHRRERVAAYHGAG